MNSEIRDLLILKAETYHHPDFLCEDPLGLVREVEGKENQEILGLLVATIAWGNRKSILKSGRKILNLMDGDPLNFILETDFTHWKYEGAVHRTFNGEDLKAFFIAFKNLYSSGKDLEDLFLYEKGETHHNPGIERFRQIFIRDFPKRSLRHISSPAKNSAAKRLHMFLRWMVRTGKVDLGLWQRLSPRYLSIPLDVHSAGIARSLGILNRQQNDAKAVFEMDKVAREIFPEDPALLDFALFGMGVNKDLDM